MWSTSPEFMTVVINGTQMVRTQLPCLEQYSSNSVPADEAQLPQSGHGTRLDLMTVVSHAPMETCVWRATLQVLYTDADGQVANQYYNIDVSDEAWGSAQAGIYVPGLPIEYELAVEHIPATAKLEAYEAVMMDAVVAVLEDPRYNAGGGSLSTVSLDNRLRHLPHFTDIMEKHGGMWRFLSSRPDVLKIWKLEVREGEKNVQKRDYRVYLASKSWEDIQAADARRAEAEREAEWGLREALVDLLKDGPKMQQDVLTSLKDCTHFTQQLLPTQALLKRFVSLHGEYFTWEAEPEQPVQVGLNRAMKSFNNDENASVVSHTASHVSHASLEDISATSSASSPFLGASDSGIIFKTRGSGESMKSSGSSDSGYTYRHDPYAAEWVVVCEA